MPSWPIYFWSNRRGDQPVKEFIADLEPQTQAKAVRIIDLLEQSGPMLSMPHAKKVADDIYELRIRGQQEIRILHGFVDKKAVLLHAIHKKQQKLPQKAISTAEKRYQQLT